MLPVTSGRDRSSYDAFISYSHAVDGQLAPKLQQALCAFAKPWYRRRAIRVFRDQTSLSATPHLWPTIEAALNASGFFIILASAGAGQSKWVAKELQTFVDRSGVDRVLIALTAGELRWNERRGDFDWTVTDALPRLSQPIFTTEPLWVDLRAIRNSDHLTLRNPDFHDAVARLSAAIRGIALDDLVGDDVRLQRQTVRLVWTVVSILLLLAAGLAIAGLYAYRKGIAAQESALRTRAEFMVSSASELEARDPLDAALVVTELDERYSSERGRRLLRKIANELPIAVLPGGKAVSSGDRTRVLTELGDGTVQVHDARSFNSLKIFKGNGSQALDAAIDRRGQRVAIASEDHTVTVWDVASSQRLCVISGYAYRYQVLDNKTVALSPDGEYVAFLSGNEARVARADGTQPAVVLSGHSAETHYVGFSLDGRDVVTTSQDRTTRVWNLDGQLENVFRVDRSYPIAALFTPDGGGVLTHDDIGAVHLWRRNGMSSVTFNATEYNIYTVALSPGGETLAAGTKEGTVLLWHTNEPQRPFVLRGHAAWVRSIDFSVDGTRLVSASDDGTLRLWRLDSSESVPIKVRKGLVNNAFFSVDGQRIFSDGVGTEVFNTESEEGEARVLRHGGEVSALEFSPDGDRIATASKDRTARVWDLTGSHPPLVLRGHDSPVRLVSFGHNGRDIMTAGDDGTARVWPIDKPDAALVLHAPEPGFIGADRSRDGKRVMITAKGVVRVWDVVSPERPRIIETSQPVESAVFSPDGTKILAICKQSAFLLSANGHGAALELTTGGHGRVAHVHFSPDSSHMVGYSAGSQTGNTVIVWRTDGSASPTMLPVREALDDVVFGPDGQRVLVLTALRAFIWPADGNGESLSLEGAPSGWMRKGVFSRDGSSIAVIDGNVALVWKTNGPGAPLLLEGHRALIEDIAISPDGTRVATASTDGTARVWSIDWPSLIKHVRTRVQHLGVCLTTDERIQYLGEEDALARARSRACLEPRNPNGGSR